MTDKTETQEQSEQPDICFLVHNEVMQLILGSLGDTKLKDTGGLYVRLLQTPRIETAQLQKALDSLKEEPTDKTRAANDE